MLLVGKDMDLIKEVKQHLSSKIDMKDLGPTHFILGMEFKRDKASKKLWLSQQKYVEGITERFNMQDCKPVKFSILVATKLLVD